MTDQSPQSVFPTLGQQGSPLMSDYARLVQGLIGHGLNASQAESEAIRQLEVRRALMPQSETGAYGQLITKAPGLAPATTGMMPGAVGQVSPFGKTPLSVITHYDPTAPGGLSQHLMAPTVSPNIGGPTSENAAPPSSPAAPPTASKTVASPAPTAAPAAQTAGGAIGTPPPAQNAPAGPVTASKGNLPMPFPPAPDKAIQLASLGNWIPTTVDSSHPLGKQAPPQVVAQAKAEASQPVPEKDWRGYLNGALSRESNFGKVPNEPDLIKSVGQFGRGNTNPLLNFETNIEAYGRAKADAQVKDKEKSDKMEAYWRERGESADNLRPELRISKGMIDNPSFTSGPVSGMATAVRSGIDEVAKLTGADPDTVKKLKDWVGSAAPNQIYTKLMSEGVLKSLRSTLGENAGQFRNLEINLLEKAWGSTNMTPEANKAVLDVIERMNERSSLISNMANEYHQKRGFLDDNFTQAIKKLQQEHPVLDNQTLEQYNKLIGGGEEAQTTKQSPAARKSFWAPTPTPPPKGGLRFE